MHPGGKILHKCLIVAPSLKEALCVFICPSLKISLDQFRWCIVLFSKIFQAIYIEYKFKFMYKQRENTSVTFFSSVPTFDSSVSTFEVVGHAQKYSSNFKFQIIYIPAN